MFKNKFAQMFAKAMVAARILTGADNFTDLVKMAQDMASAKAEAQNKVIETQETIITVATGKRSQAYARADQQFEAETKDAAAILAATKAAAANLNEDIEVLMS